jgi:hypothetical protein
MTIEQTVEIPASRRIFLDLPSELPTGRARVEFTVTPETEPEGKTQSEADIPLLALRGIHKGLDTMDAFFERKRKDKALEDTQIERQLRRSAEWNNRQNPVL